MTAPSTQMSFCPTWCEVAHTAPHGKHWVPEWDLEHYKHFGGGRVSVRRLDVSRRSPGRTELRLDGVMLGFDVHGREALLSPAAARSLAAALIEAAAIADDATGEGQ